MRRPLPGLVLVLREVVGVGQLRDGAVGGVVIVRTGIETQVPVGRGIAVTTVVKTDWRRRW